MPQVLTPVAISRYLALLMNVDRRNYLVDGKQSKENWVNVFRSSQ